MSKPKKDVSDEMNVSIYLYWILRKLKIIESDTEFRSKHVAITNAKLR